MAKNIPEISTDQPLKGANALSEDKLNRVGFASAAVSALRRVSNSAGFVISIEGPWGSGKTSTLSMMEQIIADDFQGGAVIVRFNPWLVGNRDLLLRQFFRAIAAEIEVVDHAENARNVAKELKSYSGVFDLVKWVPGAEPWASIVKGVLESAGKAAGGFADQNEIDIEGQKRRLEVALREFNKKIFVFIDDIDRLFPPEVFEMVRIIKAVGELPNVGYVVAWDSEYVRRALKSASVPRASTYIDKIVQVRLPLPGISTSVRLKLLNEAILSLPEGALANHFPKQDERLQLLYFNGLRDLLDQPRDITRVINTLSVIEPGLRGEVVLADILGLACLMVRAPRVYEELRRNPRLFTKSSESGGSGKEDPKAPQRKALEKLYARSPNPEAVSRLVQFLFPSAARARNKFTMGGQVDVEGHISAPSRLNIALSQAIGATDVSLVDAKRYIVDSKQRSHIEAKLGVDNGVEFLEMLGQIAGTIYTGEIDDLSDLCLSIARLVDRVPLSRSEQKRMMFAIPAEAAALRAISLLVSASAPEEATRIACAIAEDSASLTMAAEILSDGMRTEQRVGAIVCGPDRQKDAGERLLKNSIDALRGSRLWRCANPSRILWTIMRAAPESAKNFFDEAKREDTTLDQFALAFLKHGFSSNGGQSYALPDDAAVNNMVALDVLIAHAEKRLEDSSVDYPVRAAWQSVVSGKVLYGKDGSDARY